MVKKAPSEADAGSMAGYDPNMGMDPKYVSNSGYRAPAMPLKKPTAPKKVAPKKGPATTKRYSK